MTVLTEAMREALRLTRAGDLRDATRVIRQALRAPDVAPSSQAGTFTQIRSGSVPAAASPLLRIAFPDTPKPDLDDSRETPAQPRGEKGRFVAGVFSGATGTRAYKLWIPSSRAGNQPAPLIVMLHGCTQDADDFARGTRMNAHGERHGCYVLYPIQDGGANAQRCWRWFDSAHQQRDSGEPSILAQMTKQVVREYGLDPDRVYVAGLSAGGAMAMVLGNTHPDVFAAIAVHSGLPLGAARDVPSAFAAMAGRSAISVRSTGQAIPGIVFHGDADRTVRSSNGDGVVQQLTQRFETKGPALTRKTAVKPTHTTSSFHAADGRLMVEHWLVKGGGHAWYGGEATGSYTDPSGPDASARLVEFFLMHSRRD